MQKELIRITCDFCGTTEEYAKDSQMTESERLTAESWITLMRRYIINGQVFPVIKNACRDTCAQNLISTRQLVLPENVAVVAQRAN